MWYISGNANHNKTVALSYIHTCFCTSNGQWLLRHNILILQKMSRKSGRNTEVHNRPLCGMCMCAQPCHTDQWRFPEDPLSFRWQTGPGPGVRFSSAWNHGTALSDHTYDSAEGNAAHISRPRKTMGLLYEEGGERHAGRWAKCIWGLILDAPLQQLSFCYDWPLEVSSGSVTIVTRHMGSPSIHQSTTLSLLI